MIKLIRIFCFSVCVFSVTAFAADNSMFKPQTVVVKKGERTFDITLKSNRTTGYSWRVADYDPDLIKPIRERYIAPTSEIVGAPGQSEWTFKLSATAFSVPHITRVVLYYMRPWDATTATKKVIWVVS